MPSRSTRRKPAHQACCVALLRRNRRWFFSAPILASQTPPWLLRKSDGGAKSGCRPLQFVLTLTKRLAAAMHIPLLDDRLTGQS